MVSNSKGMNEEVKVYIIINHNIGRLKQSSLFLAVLGWKCSRQVSRKVYCNQSKKLVKFQARQGQSYGCNGQRVPKLVSLLLKKKKKKFVISEIVLSISGNYYLQTNGIPPFARDIPGTSYVNRKELIGYKYVEPTNSAEVVNSEIKNLKSDESDHQIWLSSYSIILNLINDFNFI